MENIFIYLGVAFLILVIALSLVLKKWGDQQINKRVIASAIYPLLLVIVFRHPYFGYFYDLPGPDGDLVNNVLWTLLVTLIANSIIQVAIWFFYDFIISRRWARFPRFIFNLLGLILLIVVVLVAVKNFFGVTLTGLLVGSTLISAIIGLALQDTLGNIIAGLSLNIESPFNIGDWVNLGGHEGKVVSQNWRTLTILTRESHRVSLTNKFVSEDKIINYSRPTRRQIHNYFIYLDYSHPPNKVKNIINEMLRDIPEVDISSNLGTFVVDYGDSGIKYCLRYWLYDYADILYIQDIVLSRLWYTLLRNGIMIPYPISDLRMTLQDPQASEKEAIRQNEMIESRLRSFDWLKNLNEAQIKELAANSTLKLFGQGAYLVRQGDEGDSIFIITNGTIQVTVKGLHDNDIMVKERGPGEFFGEMSLLTGEPRSASVIAQEDVEVIVLNKKAFTEVLMKEPGILELLLDILEEQRSGLESVIALDREKRENKPKSAREILLTKIKTYLGIS